MTYEEAHKYFIYCRVRGVLFNRIDRPGAKAGAMAGWIDKTHGYTFIKFRGKAYRSHNVIWLMETGSFPDGEIDHKDINRSNNRISNLRDVTRSQNTMNRNKQANNSTGIIGTAYHKRDKVFTAYINRDGKRHHLGYFPTLQKAADARKAAEKELFGVYAHQS